MSVLKVLFFDANAGLALLSCGLYAKLYRELKTGKRKPTVKATDAVEFVMHSCMALWWLFGVFFVGITGISPFWLLGWFVCGAVTHFIVGRLILVSGLIQFLGMGEAAILEMALTQEMEEKC